MDEIIIDPEFEKLIPPLKPEEIDRLHLSLEADGCLSPLIVWKGQNILLDGHNRYKYCIAHDIEFKVEKIYCSSRELAMDWMLVNQLGRRNLTDTQYKVILGDLYNSRKKRMGGDRGNQHTVKANTQCEDLADPQKTSEKIASETGVSRATVERAGAFVEALDTLGIKDQVASGEVNISQSEAIRQAEEKKSVNTDDQPPKKKRKKAEPWTLVFKSFKKLNQDQQDKFKSKLNE